MTAKCLVQAEDYAQHWGDPQAHPVAIAALDCQTVGKFALDHDQETARLLGTANREVTGSGLWVGVHAEIEPFCEVQHPDWLAGLDLRLMGHPFNAKTAYRIIGNEPRC